MLRFFFKKPLFPIASLTKTGMLFGQHLTVNCHEIWTKSSWDNFKTVATKNEHVYVQKSKRRSHLKGALSCYSVILCRFLRSKMAARRLEAAASASEEKAFTALFFFTSFELRDQSTSGYQSDTVAKSFLSRTKMGFEIRSRKWKQKDKFAHEKWGKFMETKTGLRSSTNRSWVVLVRRSSKAREVFRCSCVYFATQYNVHYDNRQAGHLLSALRLERCMTAIIFPHNKMAQKITE